MRFSMGRCLGITILFFVFLSPAFSDDGDIDLSFIAEEFYQPSGMIYATAVQSDGKILASGTFDVAGGFFTKGIVRFNTDGTVDSTFQAEIGGYVETIALHENGDVYVGGVLEGANGNAIEDIVRLDDSGQIDASFQTNDIRRVSKIILLSDEKLLVSGENDSGNEGLARLNSNGSIDLSFTQGPWRQPFALLANGEIVAARNNFNLVHELVRLSADGSQIANWSVVADARINTVLELDDGALFVGGDFTAIQGEAVTGLAKLSESGLIDESFTREGGSNVNALAVLDNGNFIVGGSWPDTPIPDEGLLSELTPTGAYSIGFQDPDPNPYVQFYASSPGNAVVRDIKLLSDGKLLVSGWFDGSIALLDDSTTVNTDFDVGLFEKEGAEIRDMALAPDGKIVVVGDFTRVGSEPAFQVARLHIDGSLDTEFDTARGSFEGGGVSSVAIQSDGNVLVGGNFHTIQGEFQRSLVRMRNDGMLDDTFNPNIQSGGRVADIVVATTGDVFIGGSLSRIAEITRNNIAKLTSTGSLDLAFDPNTNSTVSEILLEKQNNSETGSLFIGGSFRTVGGYARQRLAKLNQDGSIDLTFDAEFNNTIRLISQSPVDEIELVVGGTFSQVNAESFAGVVGLDAAGANAENFEVLTNSDVYAGLVQDDGEMVLGIVTTTPPSSREEYSLEKRAAFGDEDGGFKISLDGRVNAIQIQPDGYLLVAGAFSRVDGEKISGIFRVENTVGVLSTEDESFCFPLVLPEGAAVICL